MILEKYLTRACCIWYTLIMSDYKKYIYICKYCLAANTAFNKIDTCIKCGKQNLELMDKEPIIKVTVEIGPKLNISYFMDLDHLKDRTKLADFFCKMLQILTKSILIKHKK